MNSACVFRSQSPFVIVPLNVSRQRLEHWHPDHSISTLEIFRFHKEEKRSKASERKKNQLKSFIDSSYALYGLFQSRSYNRILFVHSMKIQHLHQHKRSRAATTTVMYGIWIERCGHLNFKYPLASHTALIDRPTDTHSSIPSCTNGRPTDTSTHSHSHNTTEKLSVVFLGWGTGLVALKLNAEERKFVCRSTALFQIMNLLMATTTAQSQPHQRHQNCYLLKTVDEE